MSASARTLAVLLLAGASSAGAGQADPLTGGAGPAWKPPALRPFEVVQPHAVPGLARVRGARLLEGLAGAPLTPASSDSPEVIARRFVRERLHPAGDMAILGVAIGGGGMRFVTLEQAFAGTPVALGQVSVAVAPDGSVLAARVGALAAAPPPPPFGLRVTDVSTARASALAAFGLPKDASFHAGDVGTEPPIAVIVALGDAAVRAWRVRLVPGGRLEHAAEVLVDAASGRPLAVSPLSQPGVDGARVVPRDPDQGTQWVQFPDPVLRPSIDSPAGWTDDVETVGNNAWSELDRDGDGLTSPAIHATATGTPAVLDFAITGDPRVDTDAALTNVFWAINDVHDRFRRLGFDEAAGNLQDQNFQRGGSGRDRVYAVVQYGSVDGSYPVNYAFSGTSQDGNFAYLAVGVFQDDSGNLRDGALETDLLYHELTHLASTRLVGGDGACFDGAQPQAVSEGWSDFMAASFTDDPVIGAWTSGRPGRGQREFPIGGGGWSYGNLCEGGCDRLRDGEVWAGTLWDVRTLLILAHGRVEGTKLAERLVLEGMRYTPCRPTLVDARDGILLADSALFAGAHRCTLWQAFAGRGLGWSTTTSGPDDMLPVGGFDMPPECGTGASVSFDQPEYSTDADAIVDVIDARPGTPDVTVTASGGDSVVVPLALVGGGPLRRGAFRILAGPVDPTDAVLQAGDGETIRVQRSGASDTALVSSALPVGVIEHHVWGTWCQTNADDDYSDAWYPLPGFLDAGENADIDVVLGHGVPVDLAGVRVQVTSLNPDVRVLPSAPIVLGDVGAQDGTTPRRFDVSFRAGALPTVTAGEIAPVRIDVTSRGRSGSTTLVLELNMDYEVVTAVSPFDGGVETFDRGSSTASSWISEARRGAMDMWMAEDCAGNNRSRGWRNGQLGCADYVEGQEASVLLSPPAFPQLSNAVAYKLRAFEWDDDVLLYSYPGTFCDADFVGLFVTPDPATLPYDDPEQIYYDPAIQHYWRPIYETTGGYTTERSYRFDTQPRLVDPSVPWDAVQLAWVFWGDIYDCGTPLPNSGHYKLDNVHLEYDIVRKVPEATPCTTDCVVSGPLVIDPPGPKCPGEPFTLRVAAEVTNCAGVVYHSFNGPGVPGSSNWTTLEESPALGQDGGYYSVYSECETSTECNDYDAWSNTSPALPGLGGSWPGSLRVRKDGGDLELTWIGAAVPPAYGVVSASSRAEVASPPSSWSLAGRTSTEGPRGEGEWRQAGGATAPGFAAYLVFGRDPCSDALRIP